MDIIKYIIKSHRYIVALIMLLIVISVDAFAQSNTAISITEFTCDKTDFDARREPNRKYDNGGVLYAIIKVTSDNDEYNLSEFYFDFGTYYCKIENRNRELWVYVQKNAKHVTVSRQGCNSMCTYDFGFPLESGMVYKMKILINNEITPCEVSENTIGIVRPNTEKKKSLRKAKEQARIEKKEENRKLFEEPVKGYMSFVDLSYTIKTGFDYVGIDYIGGYRFDNKLFLGMGVGYRMAYSPSDFEIDEINTGASLPGNTYEIPLYAYFRYNILNGRCYPFVGVSLGINLSSMAEIQLKLYDVKYSTLGAFVNPQIGVNYRMTPKLSIYLAIGFNAYTMSKCIDNTGYSATIKHSLYCSSDFYIGVSF